MKYIRKFLTSVSTTWAVCPVSKSAIQNILWVQTMKGEERKKENNIDRTRKLKIVEYGPGLWWFTHEILKHMSHDSTLTCFEINQQDFWPGLDALQDPRLIIHYTSCEHVREYIEENSVDLIISTIPLSLIGKERSLSIIKESHKILKLWWVFVTGQYVSFCKPLLQQVFWSVDHTRHLHNIPPLQIMRAIKTKEIDNR